MSDPRPIGVFDSGVGGLTVLRAIHDLLPDERTIYLGDLAYFPYGPKSQSVVRARALMVARFLVERGVKALVVACNTATSAALPDVTDSVEIPVVGVVRPGCSAALDRSRSKVIGIVATDGTVQSRAYEQEIHAINLSARVHQIACGGLVDLVEQGAGASAEAGTLVESVVSELTETNHCDTIILGCTHFPLLRNEFEIAGGPEVAIVDSASATAEALARMLGDSSMRLRGSGTSQHVFLVTAHASSFVHQAQLLFGEHIRAEVVEVGSSSPNEQESLAPAG